MPRGVECSPAFRVARWPEKGLEGGFELCEEDEVIGPVVHRRVFGSPGKGRTVGRLVGEVPEPALHVLAEELGRIRVELVGFVHVDGFFGGTEVNWWLAGECPGADVGMDKMRAPRGAVAGHEEAGRYLGVFALGG